MGFFFTDEILQLVLGTHADLIQNPEGAYHRLLNMQEGGTNSGNDAAKPDLTVSTEYLSRRVSSFSFGHDTYSKDDVLEEGVVVIKSEKTSSVKRLAYLNKPELPALLIGCVAASIHGVAFPVFGLLMATAFGIFFESPDKLEEDSRFWALMFVVVGAVLLIAVPVQNYMFGVSGGKLVQRIRSILFEKVVHQEISWFDDPANSRLVSSLIGVVGIPFWFSKF